MPNLIRILKSKKARNYDLCFYYAVDTPYPTWVGKGSIDSGINSSDYYIQVQTINQNRDHLLSWQSLKYIDAH